MKRFEPVTEEDLIALQMGELEPGRERELRRAVRASAALGAEAAAVAATLGALTTLPVPVNQAALDRSWSSLRPSLTPYPVSEARVPRWRTPLFAGLALAGAGALAFVAMRGRAGMLRDEVSPTSTAALDGPLARPDGGAVRMPVDAGFKVQLSGGVFHPQAHRPQAVIRPLGLAGTARNLQGIPLRPGYSEAGLAAGPLSEVPTSPVVAGMRYGALAGPLQVRGERSEPAVAPGLGTGAGRTPKTKHGGKPGVETVISLGIGGQFTQTQTEGPAPNAGTQGLNKTHSVLGTVRQSFRPWVGYTANFGYARTVEQNSGYPVAYAGNFPIDVYEYELSVAYTARKKVRPQLAAFADVGGGVLTFLPVHRGAAAPQYVPFQSPANVPSVNFRPLGVAAVGVEYRVKSRVGVRAEYRALLYKLPDFGELVGKALTVSHVPTVSVTYRFGGGE